MDPYLPLALALLTRWEGFKEEAYQDQGGIWTVGYGFTSLSGQPVTRLSTITRSEALPILTNLLVTNNTYLNLHCFEPLTNHQRAACLSLAYNIGMGNFGKSTLLKYLNDGAYGAASAQFLVWTYCKHEYDRGLANRREAEKACFDTRD